MNRNDWHMKEWIFAQFRWKAVFLFFFIFDMAVGFAPLASEPASSGFLDANFSAKLCEEWNKSALPAKLGSERAGGNGWIDTANKYTGEVRHKQVIIMSRRDCAALPRMQLTIENKEGKAVCSYGGALVEKYEKAEWAFAPETEQWYKFASGEWGYFQMPGIMNGFRGPMFVARANIDSFGLFWKFTGSLAKRMGADYRKGCPSLSGEDAAEIQGYLNKIR